MISAQTGSSMIYLVAVAELGLLSCLLSKHLSRLSAPDKIEEILQSGCNKMRAEE